MVPKLLYQPKWFKTGEVLAEVDMVYFPRKESALDVKRIIEMAESSARGRDGMIREVKL
jgi:hypothetical protein